MTTYAVIAAGAFVILAGFFGLVWAIVRQGKTEATSKQEAETAKRMVEHAEKTGAIIAERRDPSDTLDRMRNGTF